MAKKFRLTVGRFGLLLLLVGLVFFALGMQGEAHLDQWLSKLPKISSEEALREALSGKKRLYILENMEIGGTPCQDTLGLMKDDYVALEYRKFFYQVRYRQEEPTVPYDWNWDQSEVFATQSDRLTLFGDIPLLFEAFHPYNVVLKLSDETVKADYLTKLYDPNDYLSCYYPDGDFRDEEGNCRYEARGIKCGSLVTFLGEVGNGKVTLKAYDKKAIPRISGENTYASLSYIQNDSIGTFALLSFVFGLIGIVLVVYEALEYVSQRIPKKKKSNKSKKH